MSSLSSLFERKNLLPMIVAAGAGLLLVTGVVIGVYNEQFYRAQRQREVDSQARILAASVTAALAFDDRNAAAEYVDALGVNPEVDAAAVYDEKGGLVASYARGAPSPATPPPPGRRREGSRVVVVAPVQEGAIRLGEVYLRTTAEPSTRILTRHGGVALLLIMAFLLTATLSAAQAALRRANLELGQRARDLAEANLNLEVQMEVRERTEEALRQSQKMEAIGQLTGGVAHDFNNILMVASSGLDLMDRTTDPARRQMLKDGIRQAVDRGASLTGQLLSISRRSALQPKVIDLARQIEGMRVLLDRSLREDIAIDVEMRPGVWAVEVDPSQLEVAVLNIAVNARDAMPDGGTIRISVANAPAVADGELVGDYVRLSISDDGSGMSRETLRRIFEPFYTTKGVGKGTGLGLSQVYGFTHASGGDVRVESTVGNGTTVSLYLPRSDKRLAAPAGELTVTPSATQRQGRVLLVEDEDGVAALVTEMLSELGYEAMRAPTAAVALRLLEAQPEVDLVFSDMVMPGRMNGLELAREVNRRRPDLPVVLTTGYSEAAQSARKEGLRLLVKPYRIDALAAALDEATRERPTV